MDCRSLGRTDIALSLIGFGAFKIGRNEKIKYPQAYELPTEEQTQALLHGVLDAGINYIDTAPAYGISEDRIGRLLGSRNDEFFVSTKVGERFVEGQSQYAFDAASVRASVDTSRRRLRRDALDLVFIHSDGRDTEILQKTDVVATLVELRDAGTIRAIGFSGKTIDGARAALDWADAIMVTYHSDDQSHDAVMRAAAARGVGVIIKKGMASGQLPAAESIRFALGHPAVTSMVIGGLNLDHLRQNIQVAHSVSSTE